VSESFDEFGGELGDVGEFVEPAFDPTQVEGTTPAPGQPRGAVTSRFFDEGGAAKAVPEIESGAAWSVWAGEKEAELAREQGPPIDATQLPMEPQSPYHDELDFHARNEAVMARSARQFDDALLGQVADIGRRKEYGVTDKAALQQVAEDVEAWRREWFEGQLADGASVQQALQGLQLLGIHGYVAERIEEGLRICRYERLTSRTKMRQHFDRVYGEEPSTLYDRHPGLEQMGAKMLRRAERIQAQQNDLAAVRARSRQAAAHKRWFGT
jgi:hypothetical protein